MNSGAGHDDIPVEGICALHSTFVVALGEMACGGSGRGRSVAGAAFGSMPPTGVGEGVAVGSAVTVGLGVWGDAHADISPTSRQATAMYGIQVRISTVKDAPENRMQLLTSCRLRLLGALVVSAPMSSRASRVIGRASGSGSPRTASTHSMLPPTWLSYRSTSVATHQALSAGHQMFGGPGQK